MKVLACTLLSILLSTLLVSGCGSSTDELSPETVTPPLPFSQVAALTLPLRDVPMAEHIVFANDVPSLQQSALLADLKVIETWDGLLSENQKAKIQSLFEVPTVSGSELSYWFQSRIKYIVGANSANYTIGLVYGPDQRVGLQELATEESEEEAKFTGGVNVGSALYLTALEEKASRPNLSYIVMLVNDQWVPVLSPRVGIMGIGQALFNTSFPVNPVNQRAVSNSIKRLAVLYHEARHSDGNSGSGSTGFPHVVCPNSRLIPSEFIGVPACDDMSNGAYSVGAAIIDPLIASCERTRRCNDVEVSVLNAIRADYLSRVVREESLVKTLDPAPETGFNALNMSDFGAFNLR